MTKTAGNADRFAEAHAALKADSSTQFAFTAPPPDRQPPAWLKSFIEWLSDVLGPVGKFLAKLMPDAPVARIFLWAVIAIGIAAILWALIQRVRTGRWPTVKFRRAPILEMEAEEEWAPDAAPAMEWLREADALAEQGRFAEAIHHLLFRSIEDISEKRPDIIRPALTSREIGSARAIPDPARALFVRIVRLVERSLFGGRPVNRDDWTSARAAYADFALPGAWRA